jgi:hypothetical protein
VYGSPDPEYTVSKAKLSRIGLNFGQRRSSRPDLGPTHVQGLDRSRCTPFLVIVHIAPVVSSQVTKYPDSETVTATIQSSTVTRNLPKVNYCP